MPLYEFKCQTCEGVFELLMRHAAPTPPACPHCGSTVVEKLVSMFAASSDAQRQGSTAKAYAYNNTLNSRQEPDKRRIQIEHKHQH
jgi:putative FmdB family regulatory protein